MRLAVNCTRPLKVIQASEGWLWTQVLYPISGFAKTQAFTRGIWTQTRFPYWQVGLLALISAERAKGKCENVISNMLKVNVPKLHLQQLTCLCLSRRVQLILRRALSGGLAWVVEKRICSINCLLTLGGGSFPWCETSCGTCWLSCTMFGGICYRILPWCRNMKPSDVPTHLAERSEAARYL